ncbi:hypothetical protein [Arthrobacter sp. efr-133-TYG-118]|uniref:hypothetical protein n=1 Tax=Arthrobacter sp. efr-133-TYG-118 TaxID=3040279 RepID=UPI00254B2632|nr:hypothetical protein [Arthrobacter sp. efr-133-TYG-118]
MHRFGPVGRVCWVLGVLAVGAPLFLSCGSPSVCPAVGYGSLVTLHVTAERAATLATLGIEMCQDGTCHSFSINALTPLTPGPIPLPTPPGAPRAVPLRMADGSIDVRIEASINDHPLDLTTSGTNTSGSSIGMSHARLKPTTTYPDGRDCGGPTTAVATLDARGLRAG